MKGASIMTTTSRAKQNAILLIESYLSLTPEEKATARKNLLPEIAAMLQFLDTVPQEDQRGFIEAIKNYSGEI